MTLEGLAEPIHSEPVRGRAVKLCPPDRLPREGETITSRVTIRSVSDYVIDPDTGCWLWTKSTLRGYPTGRKGSRKPHHLYWERATGRKLPEGWHIHHTCMTRRCLNPDHLESLPMGEHYQHHAFERTGLTTDRVTELRDVARNPDLTYEDLAGMFDVDRQTVMRVIRGFRHAEGAVQVDPRPCGYRECDAIITDGRRNKRFCDADCRKREIYARGRDGKAA